MTDQATAPAFRGRAYRPRRDIPWRKWRGVVLSWASAEVARQSSRSFMWMVIGVCAGIVVFFAWPSDPPRYVGGGVVLIAVAALVATQPARPCGPGW